MPSGDIVKIRLLLVQLRQLLAEQHDSDVDSAFNGLVAAIVTRLDPSFSVDASDSLAARLDDWLELETEREMDEMICLATNADSSVAVHDATLAAPTLSALDAAHHQHLTASGRSTPSIAAMFANPLVPLPVASDGSVEMPASSLGKTEFEFGADNKTALQGKPASNIFHAAPLRWAPTYFRRWRVSWRTPVPPAPSLPLVLWAGLSAFAGMATLTLIQTKGVGNDNTEHVFLIGSFGAQAVLVFGAPGVALAQPYNAIFGNVVSAFIGVVCWKVFGADNGAGIEWLASTLAVTFSIIAMLLLRCLHPPAGATALIAVTGGSTIRHIGFTYVLLPVLTSSLIFFVVGLIMNNLSPLRERQYPAHAIPFKLPLPGFYHPKPAAAGPTTSAGSLTKAVNQNQALPSPLYPEKADNEKIKTTHLLPGSAAAPATLKVGDSSGSGGGAGVPVAFPTQNGVNHRRVGAAPAPAALNGNNSHGDDTVTTLV